MERAFWDIEDMRSLLSAAEFGISKDCGKSPVFFAGVVAYLLLSIPEKSTKKRKKFVYRHFKMVTREEFRAGDRICDIRTTGLNNNRC